MDISPEEQLGMLTYSRQFTLLYIYRWYTTNVILQNSLDVIIIFCYKIYQCKIFKFFSLDIVTMYIFLSLVNIFSLQNSLN